MKFQFQLIFWGKVLSTLSLLGQQFYYKDTPAQAFSSEFCEICKNTFGRLLLLVSSFVFLIFSANIFNNYSSNYSPFYLIRNWGLKADENVGSFCSYSFFYLFVLFVFFLFNVVLVSRKYFASENTQKRKLKYLEDSEKYESMKNNSTWTKFG